MARQIQGSQTDFSYGEVDVSLKRNDQHPARKAGLRQMANTRILNSGALQDRSGRRALFPITNNCLRIEKFTISSGNNFKIQFGAGRIQISNEAGIVVATFTTKGSGAALPWATQSDINSIVYAIFGMSIYITFGHSMRPQVVSWDGVSTWTIADYTETLIGPQKRTPFYRISPQGIAIQPSSQAGAITLLSTAALFTAAWVGTRIQWIGRQILITGFTDSTHVNATVEQPLPGIQILVFNQDPVTTFSAGDVVVGSISGTRAQVISFPGGGSNEVVFQLLTTTVSPENVIGGGGTVAFVSSDVVVGPSGSQSIQTLNPIVDNPQPVTDWDDEVMNDFRGYPASVFVDQFRIGFCDFPSVPGGIGWSAINAPFDMYVDVNPDNAIFEVAPAKVRIYYVVPGAESSEFVFCDTKLYYIPISPTNPLKPGSVGFQILSGDGCAQVQPRLAQEVILYANAGANTMMAIIAIGDYYRPFTTKNLTDFHAHLFDGITAIAVPTADGQFNERYAYVLTSNGIVVGKYNLDELSSGNAPKIGWGPWSGLLVEVPPPVITLTPEPGWTILSQTTDPTPPVYAPTSSVNWVSAWNADVYFTSLYFGVGICEVLDDDQYLDCAINVNSPTAPFAPPAGKGPLWFIPSQSVTLMDQVTRAMGTYQIDANGFIVPQFNGGENLTIASLVAGQPWTMTVEPFAADAQPGTDMHQRMTLRQISQFAVYIINSTGFMFASLFSRKQTATSPPLGTIQQYRVVPAFNQGDDATKPPTLRETVETWPAPGSSYDPRVAIIKDAPGPFQLLEIAMEVTL